MVRVFFIYLKFYLMSVIMVDLYWAYGRLMVEKCIDDDISSKNYVKIENLNTDLNLNSVLFKKNIWL